ncbi:MAG TPA: histidine kinase dimerization/phospho-acceptor domain-containing protein, partial [Bacteroidia bacterium]|nr:histidine kinase dimerization/phospho-acceptor domain-containing protein [Bacteroidia bacterium]
MSKLQFKFVIVFMIVALLGLISLQVYWISHDIKIKEDQFEYRANTALQEAVDKFESYRALNYLTATESDSGQKKMGNNLPAAKHRSNMESSGLHLDSSSRSRMHSSIRVFKKNNKEIVTFYDNQIIITPGTDVFQKFKDNLDWDQLQSEDFYFYPIDPSDENIRGTRKNTERRNNILKVDSDKNESQSFTINDASSGSKMKVDYGTSSGFNYVISYKTIQRKRDSLLHEFEGISSQTEKVILANQMEAGRDKIDKITKRYQELLNKASKELGQNNTELTPQNYLMLDTLIKRAMINNCIALPYQYAVVDITTDSILYANSKKTKSEITKSLIRAQLFPNDLIEKPIMLMINFQGKFRFVLANIWPVLLSAALFTIIIVLTSAYTIYVILRQKKLAIIKNDFINNMTHEFKTPLATIALAADSIRNPKVYENIDKLMFYTDIIKTENIRMNAQVTNVLQTAQLDKGELKMQMVAVNMHQLITEVADRHKLQIVNRNGTLNINLQAEAFIINADKLHMSNA